MYIYHPTSTLLYDQYSPHCEDCMRGRCGYCLFKKISNEFLTSDDDMHVSMELRDGVEWDQS